MGKRRSATEPSTVLSMVATVPTGRSRSISRTAPRTAAARGVGAEFPRTTSAAEPGGICEAA